MSGAALGAIGPWLERELVTRGTEIDATATVGMPTFLRYFEHLRWSIMMEPALGLAPLIDTGHFFVVRQQTIELRARVALNTHLKTRTCFESVGRSTSQVLHEAFAGDDGALVARARVLGVWLGPDRRMARLPDALREAAAAQRAQSPEPTPEPPWSAPVIVDIRGDRLRSFIAPPRVTFSPLPIANDPPAPPPEAPLYTHTITVPPRELDVFSHVNAATWLTYADDARLAAVERGLLEPTRGRGYVVRASLFYAREAAVHEPLRVAVAPLDGPFETHHALGAWCFRGDEAEPLCTMRVDLAAGARVVTAPG